jgi:hypothetical protein
MTVISVNCKLKIMRDLSEKLGEFLFELIRFLISVPTYFIRKRQIYRREAPINFALKSENVK